MKQKIHLKKEYTLGRIGEKLATNKFQEMGFNFQCNVEKDYPHDFDFLVNGKKVEVKTAQESSSNVSKKFQCGRWTFDYKKEKGKFDFLVCIGKIENKIIYLIIPAEKIKGEKAITIYPFTKTKNWKYYSQFINKWNLLR